MAEAGPEDLELIWCDECGEYHDTECPERGPLQVITTATTRARATLPPSLEMRGCTRGGEGVFCRIALLKRTQFGPLEAPRTPHMPPPRADGAHTMPLKVFSKDGVVNLDTQDESLCNWMILVRPATQHHHQNLTAYQYNHDIYFTTSQDIPAGTELRVWYAAFYAKKMSMHTLRPRGQLCLVSAEAPAGGCPSEAFTQTTTGVEEGEDKKVWRCRVCPALFEHAQQLTDHLVVHLNEAPTPGNAGSSHPNLQTSEPTPHITPLTTPHSVPHSAPHPTHHTTLLPESQTLPQTATHSIQQPPTHILPPIMPPMLSYAPPAVAGAAGFGAESTCTSAAAASPSAGTTSELDPATSTAFSGATGPGSGSGSASGTTRVSRNRKAARPYGEEAYVGLRGYGDLSASEKADGEGASHTALRRRFSRKGYRPQRVLQCEYCQKTFSNCSNFNRHVRSHGDKMFRCDECGKDFTRKESLKQHVSYKHSRPTVDIEFPHQCIGCHKAFKTEGALQFHNCQTDERTFQCGVCMKFFSTGSNLSKHRKKHGERRFACEVCHKGFYRRDVMLEHLRRHLERAKRWSKEDGDAETEGRNKYRKEPSPCPVCNKVFSCRSNMNKHLLTHGDKKYACEICGRRFYRVDVLRDHIHVHFKDIALMADEERDTFINQLGIQADEDTPPGESHEDTPHKYNCKRCQLTFARGGEYLSHIMEVHKERGFCCDICGRRFALKATYHAHMVIHRDRLPESDPTVHKYIHPCELCGRIFNSSGNLERHRVIHTGEKTHGCDVCGKCFARKDMLKEHMRVHDNIREYLCAECGKGMKTKHALRHHMKLHKGIREFACEICGRAFSQKVNMLKHMRRHSGTKDYMCELCGKTFCERNSLEVHKLVHTVGKQFECTLCQRKFVTDYMLHKHEQLTHQRVEARACDACGAKVSTRASLTRHLKRKHPELVHIHFAQGQDLENTPTITIVPSQLTTLQMDGGPAPSSPGTKLEMHATETTHQVVVTVTESLQEGSVTCEDGSLTCDNGGVVTDDGACREVSVTCGEAGVASAMVGVSLESAILATLDMVQRAGGSIHITPTHGITSSLGQTIASLEQPVVTYTSASSIVSLPGQNVTYTISPSSGAVAYTSAAVELPSPGHSTALAPSPALSCGEGHCDKMRVQGNVGADMDDEDAGVLACAHQGPDALVLKHAGAGALSRRGTDVHAHGGADAHVLAHGHADPQELAGAPWVTHGGEDDDDVVADMGDVNQHSQHEHMEQNV